MAGAPILLGLLAIAGSAWLDIAAGNFVSTALHLVLLGLASELLRWRLAPPPEAGPRPWPVQRLC